MSGWCKSQISGMRQHGSNWLKQNVLGFSPYSGYSFVSFFFISIYFLDTGLLSYNYLGKYFFFFYRLTTPLILCLYGSYI